MEDGEKPVTNPRQPSKLDDHPLIPIGEFQDRMREVLAVTPEEVARREAEYQREQAAKTKGRKQAA